MGVCNLYLAGCGWVWVGMTFFDWVWERVGGLTFYWLGVGECYLFLTGCGWVCASMVKCGWVCVGVGESMVYNYPKQLIKVKICQKHILQCRRFQKLNFVGLVIRFSYFLNQLINTNANVNIK